jgi:hypothetical protein
MIAEVQWTVYLPCRPFDEEYCGSRSETRRIAESEECV